MACYLTFFCRSGRENGSSALAAFLAKPAETGDPVLIRHPAAGYVDEVDVCKLAAGNGSGMPAAGWLTLELSVGAGYNAEAVISADPSDEHGTWGSDLRAQITLSGGSADWPLVNRVRAALAALWPAIARDEMSGFEVDKDAPEPA